MINTSRKGAAIPAGINVRGWLLVISGSLYVALAFAVTTARFVGDLRDEQDYSDTTWLISTGIGIVVGLAAAVSGVLVWRRRGGQRVVDLAARAIRTGELPTSLPLRIAVLRELERREKLLERQTPAIVIGGLWTLIVVLRIVSDPSMVNVAGALLIWGFAVAYTARDVIDRRRRPQLLQLINHLREHPVDDSPVPARTL